METLITRRDAIQRVAAMLGGVALTGSDRLLAATFDPAAQTAAMASGVGEFSAADVALLDEIAETMLPETSTPGAKAARTGAFMALMVTEAYTAANQAVFRDGLSQIDARCREMHGTSFMDAGPEQRLALLQQVDREQQAQMDERLGAFRSRAPLPPRPADDIPRHYFRLMKELALIGYFTSEIGCTQAQRYIESPGRFDPCVQYTPGEKSWAPHA